MSAIRVGVRDPGPGVRVSNHGSRRPTPPTLEWPFFIPMTKIEMPSPMETALLIVPVFNSPERSLLENVANGLSESSAIRATLGLLRTTNFHAPHDCSHGPPLQFREHCSPANGLRSGARRMRGQAICNIDRGRMEELRVCRFVTPGLHGELWRENRVLIFRIETSELRGRPIFTYDSQIS